MAMEELIPNHSDEANAILVKNDPILRKVMNLYISMYIDPEYDARSGLERILRESGITRPKQTAIAFGWNHFDSIR